MNPQLVEIITEVLGISAGDIHADLVRGELESWDSLRHLSLITAIENQFAVQFTMDEIESIETIGELTASLEEHMDELSRL